MKNTTENEKWVGGDVNFFATNSRIKHEKGEN